jgi:hypothetical protein
MVKAKKVATKKPADAKAAAKPAPKPRAPRKPAAAAPPPVAPSSPPVAPVEPLDNVDLRGALAKVDALRTALDDAQAELRILRTAHEASRVDQQWQSQANARELDDATQSRAAAERKAVDLQQRLDAAMIDLEARRHEVEEARRDVTELRAALESARQKGRCPKCGERMIDAQLGGAKVARCRGCDAVVIDAAELDRFSPRTPDQPTLTDVPLGAAPPSTTLPEDKPGFWKGLFKRKPSGKEGE